MKKINFKRGFWTVVVAVLLTTTLVSCDSFKRKGVNKNWSMEVSHPFPNTNWAFEEEVLNFDFEIKDTTKYYDVTVSLLYDTSIVALRVIPLTLTLTSPDGMQSIASSQFLLDSKNNKDIRPEGNSNNAVLDVVVYPHRKFKNLGTHKLSVYRRAEKADNYGFISLSTKVSVAQ